MRRVLTTATCFIAVFLLIAVSIVMVFVRSSTASATRQHRHDKLTLQQRVAYQRAIEEIYWQHRIWPKENPDPKPPLDEVMPISQIQAKVENYLRKSKALESYWQHPIEGEQLQAEIERLANQTRQPGVLREIFKALENDPYVIAECLARQVLAERLIWKWYAFDERFHGNLKRAAEAELSGHKRIEEMKQSNGKYNEVSLVKQRAGEYGSLYSRDGSKVELSREEWNEQIRKLRLEFAKEESRITRQQKQEEEEQIDRALEGRISNLQEDEERYYVRGVIKVSREYVKVGTVEWRKEPFDSWWERVGREVGEAEETAAYEYRLMEITSIAVTCSNDNWTATSTTNAPAGRAGYPAVWTGSEMIVWGGFDGINPLNTGGRYNPSTDSWTATNITNAPSRRTVPTAVWTGNEMIVWGGASANTGGRYNPISNTWIATSTANAPSARASHIAIWTGSEMIVWGGFPSVNTGGRYNPNTDSWTATSTTNAPAGRSIPTAVWTGNEMIVWGGNDGDLNIALNTGGRYNPSTNTWTATSTTSVPSTRLRHTAVWTDSEMIVWGGYNGVYLNTGGRYNPSTDSWTATSTTNAPPVRLYQTAVWTGSEMIVWGGHNGINRLNTGGRYNPISDTWIATSSTNVPSVRSDHTAVWTGGEMIVWSGFGVNYVITGGRYIANAYVISPTSQSMPASGGNNIVNVIAASQCSWNDSSNDSWIMITNGGSGSGNGIVNYSVAANVSTSPRTGTMTIAGQTFTVTQAGGPPVPRIMSVTVNGKSLIVNGENFDSGAKLLLNGDKQKKVSNDPESPASRLIAKKSGKKIQIGDKLQVRNPDGVVSEEFTFTGQ